MVSALCALHLVLGLSLLPEWMFSKYPDAAALLAQGKLPAHLGADYSPLYLLLNTWVGPLVLRVVQSLLGGAAVVCTFLIGRRLAGPAAGLIGATLLALSEPLFLYEATLEPDLPIAVLNALALALLVEGRARSTVWLWVAAGVCTGASIALRPNGALFLLAALVWLGWQAWTEGRARRGLAMARATGPFLLASLLTAALPVWALHSSVRSEVGATMSVGAVLHMGNRPEGTGLGAQPSRLIKFIELQERSIRPPDYAHELYRQFARLAMEQDSTSVGAERYWVERVLAFVREEPGAFFRLWWRKGVTFVFGPDGHDVAEVQAASARLQSWPLFPGRWLGLVGAAGLVWMAVHRRGGLLAAYLASLLSSALVFYVVARYRLAALPAWAVLGGGLVAALPSLKESRRSALGYACVWLGAVGLAMSTPFLGDIEQMLRRGRAAAPPAQAMTQQLHQGRLTEAGESFVQLTSAQPLAVLGRGVRGLSWQSQPWATRAGELAVQRFGDSAADLYLAGVLAARSGRWEAALEAAQASAHTHFRSAIFDVSLDPQLLAAEALRHLGRFEEARAQVEQSLARWPGTLDGLSHAVAAAARATDSAALESHLAKLEALHDPLSARYALAVAHNDWGNHARALENAEWVLTRLPSAAVLHHEKARALLGLARYPEALASYDAALRLFPGRAFDDRLFAEALKRTVEAEGDNPQWRSLWGEHLLRQGDLEAARSHFAAAREHFGSHVPSWHLEREAFLSKVAASSAVTGR